MLLVVGMLWEGEREIASMSLPGRYKRRRGGVKYVMVDMLKDDAKEVWYAMRGSVVVMRGNVIVMRGGVMEDLTGNLTRDTYLYH